MRPLIVVLVALLASLLGAVRAHADDATPWTGDWDLKWSAGGAHARLVQTGDALTGEVLLLGSSIEGTISGDQFTGTRNEGGRSNALVLILDRESDSLVGHDDARGWCSATRLRCRSCRASARHPARGVRGVHLCWEPAATWTQRLLETIPREHRACS